MSDEIESQNEVNTAEEASSAEKTGSAENTKTGLNDFKKKFFGFLDSAGNAISDFGDKSVVRIEITQLNSKLDKAYKELGRTVYEALSQGEGTSVSSGDENIASKLTGIKELLEGIEKREKALSEEKKSKK